MQATMTIQENGVFIQLPDYILANLQKTNSPTIVNFEFDSSGKLEMSMPVTKDFVTKQNTISPEVMALAGSLKPHMATEEISGEEQAFLQAINEDDERIKAYGI